MKKFISLLVVAAFALTLVPVAKADTISDLMAQIAALQAQIAALSGATSGTTCFSTNLKLGMRSNDVKLLQEKLGVSNTGYFGPLTLAAVKKFQGDNGVPTTGFVGELTRAQLNAKFCVASTTTTTAAGTTGAATEGSISVTSAPVALVSTIYGGDTNKAVYAFNVQAKNSDVSLKKVDVELKTTAGGTMYFPWKSFSNIYLYDGSTKIATLPITSSSLIENALGYSYIARFDGLNIAIAKDATHSFTVTVDVLNNPSTYANGTIGLVANNAIRVVDGIGLSQYNSNAPTAASINLVTTNSTATVTVFKDVNSPIDSTIKIDSVNVTSDVPAMIFDVKTTGTDITIKNATITLSNAAGVSAVKLYDGNTLLSSKSASTSVTFDNLNIALANGATKALTVKLDFAANSTAVVTVSNPGVIYLDSNYNSGAKGATANGAQLTASASALTVSFVSGNNTVTPATSSSSAYATGIITFTIQSNGATTNKLTAADVSVYYTANGTTTKNYISSTDYIVTSNPNQDYTDGATPAVVTVNTVLQSSSLSSSSFVTFGLTKIGGANTDWDKFVTNSAYMQK